MELSVIVRLMDTTSATLNALRVGADDGRNPTHLMGWKNRKENDYGTN